jgi:hypothetical protein
MRCRLIGLGKATGSCFVRVRGHVAPLPYAGFAMADSGLNARTLVKTSYGASLADAYHRVGVYRRRPLMC